eukprot:6886344-Alexandrium_andersonii.AAC.1
MQPRIVSWSGCNGSLTRAACVRRSRRQSRGPDAIVRVYQGRRGTAGAGSPAARQTLGRSPEP